MVGGLRPSGSPARRHQNCGFFGNSRVNPPKWKNGSLARLFYPEKHVHGFPFILFSAFFTLLFLPIPQQRPEQAKTTKRAKFIDRILFAFFFIFHFDDRKSCCVRETAEGRESYLVEFTDSGPTLSPSFLL